MLIKEIKLKDYPYSSRKGLSERIVKNYFLKSGFEVFKGNYILGREFSSNYYLYENVQNKYRRFEQIIQQKIGIDLDFVRNSILKIQGVPDFFVYRKLDDKSFFVEVKLENEQIKQRQYDCICLVEDIINILKHVLNYY